jgi:hypothetical protein
MLCQKPSAALSGLNCFLRQKQIYDSARLTPSLLVDTVTDPGTVYVANYQSRFLQLFQVL